MKDYYKVLGLGRDATQQEIKAAYRNMVKKYHPDMSKSTPEKTLKYQEAVEAYEVLGKEQSKRQYDIAYDFYLKPKEVSNANLFSALDEAYAPYHNFTQNLQNQFAEFEQRAKENNEFLNQLKEELDEMEEESIFTLKKKKKKKKRKPFWKY